MEGLNRDINRREEVRRERRRKLSAVRTAGALGRGVSSRAF